MSLRVLLVLVVFLFVCMVHAYRTERKMTMSGNEISVKIMSFNVLGLGFTPLPGNENQWKYWWRSKGGWWRSKGGDIGWLEDLLTKQEPRESGMSLIGLQEDIYVDLTGNKEFERVNIIDDLMEESGYKAITFSIHDGMPSNLAKIVEKGDFRKTYLFRSPLAKWKLAKTMKLGNTLWYKEGQKCPLKFSSARAEVFTTTQKGTAGIFTTTQEGTAGTAVAPTLKYANLPQEGDFVLPMRSAAVATFSTLEGEAVLDVAVTHLAGGKFDDTAMLAGRNKEHELSKDMLRYFAGKLSSKKAILFGDTNMKSRKQVTKRTKEIETSLDVALGACDEQGQVKAGIYKNQFVAFYQAQDQKVDTETGILEKDSKCIEIERRRDHLKQMWTLDDTIVPGFELVPVQDKDDSSVFGFVIDHILHKGFQPGSITSNIYYNEKIMKKKEKGGYTPEASDHFPHLAEFVMNFQY